MSNEDEAAEPIEVPASELSPEVLTALIEAFVLREGTDYGAVERSFASKVADVRVQLARGEAKITFEPASESIGIARVR